MQPIVTLWQRLLDTFIVPVKDFRVLGWMILLGTAAHFVDPQGLQVLGIVLYVAFFWLLALSLRKISFPYRHQDETKRWVPCKLSDFFREALKGNIAAAIVASAIIFMQVAIAFSFTMWMR